MARSRECRTKANSTHILNVIALVGTKYRTEAVRNPNWRHLAVFHGLPDALVVQVRPQGPRPGNRDMALGRAVHSSLGENFAQKVDTRGDLPSEGADAPSSRHRHLDLRAFVSSGRASQASR